MTLSKPTATKVWNYQMDPLHLCIALGPVAVYLLVLGMINLWARPFLTTGARDTTALGLAVTGFAVAGPMELFLPENAVDRFGSYAWLLLFAFYGLFLTLIVLLMRPRLVIYNTTVEQMRPILASVVADLDGDARWAGECLVLPRLGIQLNIESVGALRNVQLISAGAAQNYAGWRHLEIAVGNSLRDCRGTSNRIGYIMLFVGVLTLGVVTAFLCSDPQTVAQSLKEMLRQQ